MGYEVKLILVDKREKLANEIKEYGSVVAIIDLSKIDGHVNLGIAECEEDGLPIEFYLPGDGNTKVDKDMYDKEMKAFRAERMLSILDTNPDKKYRRYRMARPLLKEFIKGFGEAAYVVAYGH